jgi:hypothetical protein
MPCLPPAFKTHPLYALRLSLLLSVPPAFFFAILSITDGYTYSQAPFIWHVILSTASAVINIYELTRWGLAKLHDPDAEPRYPLRRILVADALLVVFFALAFVAEIENAHAARYSGYSGGVVESYSSMAALVAAVLHVICAWRQLMAVKRREWEREVEAGDDGPEEGCGHYLRTRCTGCGAKVVWYRDGEVPRGLDTPTSSAQVVGGLDLATGYEVIPDKVPEADAARKVKKGKGASRLNSPTSLMEV